MTAATDYDVIIAGCGPVGVIAAHLLGARGISTLVIERDHEPYALPRAVHFDHEIMRILQSVGLAGRILPQLYSPAGAMHFGVDRAVIRQFQAIVETDRLGWASDYHFYQPDLENVLREALAERDSVTLLRGHDLETVKQDADTVVVTARTNVGEFRASAKYLLGCDGGRSSVRRCIGGGLDDLGFDEPWIVVDALVDGPVTMPDLYGTPEGVDMQAVIFIIGDPARPTSVIPSVGRHRRWEFMMLPGETGEDYSTIDAVRPLVAPWLVGCEHELVRTAVYRFHALIAQNWQDDRVFLVGDSAHQTPPFFGQGLCHGIRDAANLSWKLGMVLDGSATPALLQTYQPERLPQVRTVVEASMRVGRYLCTLDPATAAKRDVEMRAVAARTAPGYVDLIPALTCGILDPAPDRGEATGSRFIQPPVLDVSGERVLLDDATGGGFVVLTTCAAAFATSTLGTALEERFGIGRFLIDGDRSAGDEGRSITDCTGELTAWLTHHAAVGVVLRPDAYVYGTFADGAGGLVLLDGLHRQLTFD